MHYTQWFYFLSSKSTLVKMPLLILFITFTNHICICHLFVISNTRFVIVEAQIGSDYLRIQVWLHKPPGPRAVYDLQESERVREGERERQEDEENRLADWKLQLRCWDNGAKHLISVEHSNQGSPSLLSDSSSHFHLCRHTYMHQFYSMEQ